MEIRGYTESDSQPVFALRRLAFGGSRSPGIDWPGRPDAWRGLVADLDGSVAGFLRIYPYRQFFGGRAVPMGGVASVAVAPHARGQGVAKSLLTAALEAMRADGQCVSALYPSAVPLYRSRGWEQAGVHERVDLPIGIFTGLPPGPPCRPATAADLPALHALYLELAATVDGLLDRSTPPFQLADVLHCDIVTVVPGPGGLRGYLMAERPSGPRLIVQDLVFRDPAAGLTLLGQLGSWAGQLSRVDLRLLDPAVLGLLTPLPMFYPVTAESWMFRVVDFPTAIAARGWPGAVTAATVDLHITDDHAPWNSGPWRIVVSPEGVHAEPGGTGAIHLTARGLSSWYAGTQHTTALRRAGLLDGAPADALDLLTAAPRTPRMADTF